MTIDSNIVSAVEACYRSESRRVYASLVRLLRDFDLAEESLQEAFAAAMERWPINGIPENPRAWLVSTGRFKAIDALRRRNKLDSLQPELTLRAEQLTDTNSSRATASIEDDRLRLIFVSCHPAIDPQIQIALTLREVCGLTTEEIAAAFLVTPSTMAQRIVRGKAKIRDAGIPFYIPEQGELAERLDTVLSVCYLVFNEGYSVSAGNSHTRLDLTSEAIRLGRLLAELIPDAEVYGLMSLMLFHESRRTARTDKNGDLVLLEDQDRRLWNREMIREARWWLAQGIESGEIGSYTIQAAISAVHSESATAANTDWKAIVAWYDLLMQATPTSVVELNRAVAVAMRDGPEAGLSLLEPLSDKLHDYHLFHAARGDLLRRMGKVEASIDSLTQALALAKQEPERRFLERRLRDAADRQRI